MATLIQAVSEFRPRVRTPKTIGLDTLATRLVPARWSLTRSPEWSSRTCPKR